MVAEPDKSTRSFGGSRAKLQPSRRTFIRSAGAAAAVLPASCLRHAALEDEAPAIVDCHAHLYSADESTYPMRDDPRRPPPGTGTVEDLKRDMAWEGVTHATLVQTSSYYQWDNRLTVDTARAHPKSMTAVVTLDPNDPESVDLLERYVAEGHTRGMRSIPARSGMLDDPGVDRLWAAAEKLGIVVNALVGSDKRQEIESLSRRHPRLRVVLDHSLRLKAGEAYEQTLKDLLTLARNPNIFAKLTFMPTGSAEAYPFTDLHDACKALIDAYTPQRCVWGSHFPTALFSPKATYAQSLSLFTHELGLDAASKKAILGKTALGLWFDSRSRPKVTEGAT